jgi:hypothetical protein
MTQSGHPNLPIAREIVNRDGIGLSCCFAKPFDVGFGLLRCLIGVFANLCKAFVLTGWPDIDDKTGSIRRADDPPIGKDRSSESTRDKSSANQGGYALLSVSHPRIDLGARRSDFCIFHVSSGSGVVTSRIGFQRNGQRQPTCLCLRPLLSSIASSESCSTTVVGSSQK